MEIFLEEKNIFFGGGGLKPENLRAKYLLARYLVVQRNASISVHLYASLYVYGVVFAVYVADGPFAACLRQLLAQVVAFSEEDPQVVPVAAPSARHHHNNKQRIQFKS